MTGLTELSPDQRSPYVVCKAASNASVVALSARLTVPPGDALDLKVPVRAGSTFQSPGGSTSSEMLAVALSPVLVAPTCGSPLSSPPKLPKYGDMSNVTGAVAEAVAVTDVVSVGTIHCGIWADPPSGSGMFWD